MMPTSMSSPVAVDALIAGKYRVGHVLGEGGMGVVVEAVHVELGHRVAIKLLLDKTLDEPNVVARFEQEARAAAGLLSDHVVRVIDVGCLDSGLPFMVMEKLEGENLADALDRRRQFPIEEAVSVVLQACDAIAEAHGKGIIHRDLKPANLFLARKPNGSTTLKVLDFGISKVASRESCPSPHLTGNTSVMGSPTYMSPEQLRATRDVDGRSDLYSLGVTLFELLAGTPPFVSESIPELCALILKDDAPKLRTFRPDVSPSLEAIVMRAIAREPRDRFDGIEELAAALVEEVPAAVTSRLRSPISEPPATRRRLKLVQERTLDAPRPPLESPPAAARSKRSMLKWGATATAIAVAALLLGVAPPSWRGGGVESTARSAPSTQTEGHVGATETKIEAPPSEQPSLVAMSQAPQDPSPLLAPPKPSDGVPNDTHDGSSVGNASKANSANGKSGALKPAAALKGAPLAVTAPAASVSPSPSVGEPVAETKHNPLDLQMQ